MEFDIYYPYGIPYYLNEPFLTVHFVNNEESFVPIHFVTNKKKDKLAGLLPPLTKRKYSFPVAKNHVVIFFSDQYISFKLEDGWTYTIP